MIKVADMTRRPGARRLAATMACPSIWLPSTTGRRSSPRATPKKREPVLGGTDVHHVNQMRGIAPRGEPLHRHVLCGVPLGLVSDLNPDPVLIERCVVGQLRERSAGRTQPDKPSDDPSESPSRSMSSRGK